MGPRPTNVEAYRDALKALSKRIETERDPECLRVLLVEQRALLKGLSDLPFVQTGTLRGHC
jgi:hypothetical protein